MSIMEGDSMKKIQVSKWQKYLVVSVLIIGGFATGIMAYRTYNIPKFVETEIVDYSHQWTEDIHWLGKLITSPVFPKSELDDDDFVYRDYTKLLKVEFVSKFIADQEVEMEGVLSIVGILEAQYGPEKDTLWTRKYPLLSEETFAFKGRTYDFSKKVDVDLVKPRELLDKITEDFNVGATYVYRIVYSVDGSINKGEEKFPFVMNPSLEIPILASVGTNTLVLSEVKDLTITELDRSFVPVNMTMFYLFLAICILCFLMVLMVLILIGIKEKKDEFDLFSLRLIREHEDRMVRSPVALTLNSDLIMTMVSVEDIVKTADELSQPIFFYQVNEKNERKVELYVFDDVRVYYFVKMGVIKSCVDVKETKETKVKKVKKVKDKG